MVNTQNRLAGPRYALIIATTEYHDPHLGDLTSPAEDARVMAEVLASPEICQFTVRAIVNQSHQTIRDAIGSFVSNRSPDDVLLIYISGHGIRNLRGQLFFAVQDTEVDHLAVRGLESRWLLDRLAESRVRQQILILDCCHSGAYAKGIKGLATPAQLPMRSDFMTDADADHLVPPGRGQVVLTASRAAEPAFEGQPEPDQPAAASVFTAGLVEGVRSGRADRNQDGFITVGDAFDYASRYVRDRGGRQNPQQFVDGFEADIWLARNPNREGADLANVLEVLHRSGLPAEIRVAAVSTLGRSLLGRNVAQAELARAGLERVVNTDESEAVVAAARAVLQLARPARTGTSRLIRILDEHPDGCRDVAFSPDGQTLATASGTSLYLRAADTGEVHTVLRGPRPARLRGIAFSPHSTVLAAAAADETIDLWDLSTSHIRLSLTGHLANINSVAFSPDGLILAGGSADGTVRLWHSDTGAALRRLTEHRRAVHCVAFSPDGQRLVSAGADAAINLWDLPAGTHRPRLAKHTDSVHAVTFSPDGAALASASADGTVHIWNARSFDRYATLAPDAGELYTVAYSPDGHLIAAAGAGGTAFVWRTSTRRLAFTLAGHREPVRRLAFSAGSEVLVTASDDRTARMWNVKLR